MNGNREPVLKVYGPTAETGFLSPPSTARVAEVAVTNLPRVRGAAEIQASLVPSAGRQRGGAIRPAPSLARSAVARLGLVLLLGVVLLAVSCGSSSKSSADAGLDGTVDRDGQPGSDLSTADTNGLADTTKPGDGTSEGDLTGTTDSSSEGDLTGTTDSSSEGDQSGTSDLANEADQAGTGDTAQPDQAGTGDTAQPDQSAGGDTAQPDQAGTGDTAQPDQSAGGDTAGPGDTIEDTAPPGDTAQPGDTTPDLASQSDVSDALDVHPAGSDTTTSGTPPVIAGCAIFPADNPWNTDISKEPVDSNSTNLIAGIGNNTGLHPDFGTVYQGAPNGIPFVIVDGNTPLVAMHFDEPGESDPGPYPIPTNPPIEGGPDSDGDRHVLVLRTSDCKLFEAGNMYPRQDGGWDAFSGAIFDLSSNALRKDTWTSADAAGLPIFPGLVKYDEVESGEIKHALRFTVGISRKAFVHPGTHWASDNTDANRPPMGMRVRLKASFDVSGFSPRIQVILEAMKTYGMFVADNGSNWYVSGAPDPRWDDDELATLSKVKGSDFEVVKMGTIYTPADF